MNQIVINYGDAVERPVKIEWSIKDENGIELIVDKSAYYDSIEVFTIPYDMKGYSKLFAVAKRFYDDGNGGLTEPDIVGPITVLNPKSSTYDNARLNDPIYKPSIETYVDNNDIVLKLFTMKTLFNIASLEHITISIVDSNGTTVYYGFNVIVPEDSIIRIPIDSLTTSIPHGVFNISIMEHSDLNEASKFNISEVTIGDNDVTILSNREDLSIQPTHNLNFIVNNPDLTINQITLTDTDDNIVHSQIYNNIDTFTIPKNTMEVNTRYNVNFISDDKVITIPINTRQYENIYVKRKYNYKYETEQVSVDLDIEPGFNLEVMSDYCLTYPKVSTIPPLVDITTTMTYISDKMDDIYGYLNSTTVSQVDSIDDLHSTVTSLHTYLVDNQYKSNEYKQFIQTIYEYSNQYRASMYVVSLTQEQYSKVAETIANMNIIRKILQEYTYNLPVDRIFNNSDDKGLIAFNDIIKGAFSTIAIRYDTMIIDTIDLTGKRLLTCVRLDTISFANDTVYSIEVPRSIKTISDGSNDIVYNPSNGLVYLNNIISDGNGGKKTEFLSFNPKTREFIIPLERLGLVDGTKPNYIHNTLSYLGNGLILSVGSISDDDYINKTAFIFDSISGVWDNVADIDLMFSNKELMNIPMINGDVLFIPKDRTENRVMIFKNSDMDFVYKTMEFGNPNRNIEGVLRTHTPNPILVTEEVGYSII